MGGSRKELLTTPGVLELGKTLKLHREGLGMVGRNHCVGLSEKQGSQSNRHSHSPPQKTLSGEAEASL